MRPKRPQQLYEKTAERLNLPKQFIEDVVEYFYSQNKAGMHSFSHVIFNFTGLGRFILRPRKFWRREKGLAELLETYKQGGGFRADRGIMIRQELEKRFEQMQNIKPAVQEYYEYRKNQRFKPIQNDQGNKDK